MCKEDTGVKVLILCADILSPARPKYQEGLILRVAVWAAWFAQRGK